MLMLFLSSPAFAGAWLQADDGLLVSTQALHYRTDSYYDTGGEELAQQRFTKNEINLYMEYGWRENLTIGTNLFLNQVNQGRDNIGIADPELFARLPLLKGECYIFSIQPLIKLPSWYQHAGTPRGGTESFDGELSLLFGWNLPVIHARDYLDLRIGYRERTDGLNGQYRFDIAYGLHLSDSLAMVPAFRAIRATESDAQAFSNNGALDYDLYKTEMNLYYAINDFQQLSLGYFSHFAGEQTGAGQGIMFGLLQRF